MWVPQVGRVSKFGNDLLQWHSSSFGKECLRGFGCVLRRFS